jgi:hypothetical protein
VNSFVGRGESSQWVTSMLTIGVNDPQVW